MSEEKRLFYENHAAMAMEQQQRYGIPASVTLAQAWWEKGAANRVNNCFGIKADKSWLAAGRPYEEFKDDEKGLSKFRCYGSKAESFEDHSRFLLQNRRYFSAYGCSSTDYHGWLSALQKGGYSTNPSYVSNLEREIRDYGLDKYDRQAVADAQAQNLQMGYMRGRESSVQPHGVTTGISERRYGMPLRDSDTLHLTSDYGFRNISYGSKDHKGIDLHAAKGTTVYATEDNGVVIGKGYQASSGGKAGGGNYVYVAYPRPDGSFVVTGYLHLDQTDVRIGDKVSASTSLGKSGNTGGVAAHLDFRVCTVTGADADALRNQMAQGLNGYNFSPKSSGTFIDPKGYLAEIAVRGSLDTTLVRGGDSQDLLAQYKAGVVLDDSPQQRDIQQLQDGRDIAQENNISTPHGLFSLLFGDKLKDMPALDGVGGSGDLIGDLVGALFSGAMAMVALHNGTTEQEVTEQADQRDYVSEEEKYSAVIDRPRVEQAKADGVDARQLQSMTQMNAEAIQAEQQQQQQQQRGMSMG